MVIHRAADIHQHQDLDAVPAFRLHFDIQIAGIVRGGADRIIERELLLRAFTREAAQTPQRNLDVARAEFAFAVEVAVGAGIPHLDRGTLAAFAFAADTDALGVFAAIAKGRGAACAYPLAAALMAFLLLFPQLLQAIHL